MNLKEKLNALKQVREFWIRKGTGNWDYKDYGVDDVDSPEYGKPVLDKYDQYYDAVSFEPAKGGIHVVEANEWTSLIEALESACDAIERECYCEKLHPDIGGKCGACHDLIKIDALLSKESK